MVAARKQAEHAPGIFVIAWFTKHFIAGAVVAEADDGIGGKDDVGGFARNAAGLFFGDALHKSHGGFRSPARFAYETGAHNVGQARGEQEFMAAGRC
jgi:hypothetical protein